MSAGHFLIEAASYVNVGQLYKLKVSCCYSASHAKHFSFFFFAFNFFMMDRCIVVLVLL